MYFVLCNSFSGSRVSLRLCTFRILDLSLHFIHLLVVCCCCCRQERKTIFMFCLFKPENKCKLTDTYVKCLMRLVEETKLVLALLKKDEGWGEGDQMDNNEVGDGESNSVLATEGVPDSIFCNFFSIITNSKYSAHNKSTASISNVFTFWSPFITSHFSSNVMAFCYFSLGMRSGM